MDGEMSTTFRNSHVAAPLKVPLVVPALNPHLAFRNSHVAAPLKEIRKNRGAAADDFPQLSCCGPIEGSAGGTVLYQTFDLSATLMLRPH